MKLRESILTVLALLLLAGCASTTITQQTPMVANVPRPHQIWVYNFVADPSQMPSEVLAGAGASSTPPSAQDIAQGQKMGVLIAQELAADISAMGIPAVQAGPDSTPHIGDGVIKGYLVSVQSGSAEQRSLVGFGQGASEMKTVVEGFGVTPTGLRKMGSGELDSSSGKAPGMVMPGAVALATGNPIGLIVVGGMKIYGEESGKNTLEGRAKSTADAIAAQLKTRFQARGWVS